ncbi:FAD-binding oxidoreductase [Phenylobacterium koreense]|uniref:FAD/FMN-containing dehydrogenase n=1 Tax=Phenylobacterium koreense TaxID=266125 RepID=A0ABV2EMX8_9CAUL
MSASPPIEVAFPEHARLLEALTEALGPGAVVDGRERVNSPDDAPIAVLRPSDTAEVALILRTADEAGAKVVPWGGRTGLVRGTMARGALALSMERMNRIEEIDVLGQTMTVQAGCVLETATEAAEAAGLILPLDLGSRGSATIGGAISTNAGGNRVIRYGMTRNMVLGLEAVLADGTVVTSLNRLIKNNTGYDLKQLFIGSEGTLGVVTRAVLHLRPGAGGGVTTALVAVPTLMDVTTLLRRVEGTLSGHLSAFEVMWDDYFQLVTTEPARGRSPWDQSHAYHVLIEAMSSDGAQDAERLENLLGDAMESREIADAVIAKSQVERDAFWAMRDDVRQVARFGPIMSFDVSLPISEMEGFVAEVRKALAACWSQTKPIIFGHLGDGNLHVIVAPVPAEPRARARIEDIVYSAVRERDGSISAEHGIGLEKKAYLSWSRSPEEVALMRRLKVALDPRNTLNPGKVIPDA